jgi:hypothetical protein
MDKVNQVLRLFGYELGALGIKTEHDVYKNRPDVGLTPRINLFL